MRDEITSKKLEILRSRSVLAREPIGPWEMRLADYRGPGDYELDGDWAPLPAPAMFPALKTVFLRTRADIPPARTAAGVRFLEFGFDGLEALLSVDDQPYAGLDANHRRVPVPAPGPHALGVEGMSLMRAYCEPELRGAVSTFAGAGVVEIDTEVESSYLWLRLVWETVGVLPEGRRRSRLAAALEEALLEIDLTLDVEGLRADAVRARQLLESRLSEVPRDPEDGNVFLAGHTHIDTAWLWPLAETVRKCGRTFATALRLMELYPGYHFSCSQAQLYLYTKQHFPHLYEQIKARVAEGRWHTTGAMWVETDCNVTSGESLIRQILHGLAFFAEEFGTRPRTCWLPDVFGYPGNLPQILKGAGLDYFMTCKLHWQATNPFPFHLFWWEGIDGSRVLAHIPKLRSYYNGFPNPEQLRAAWANFSEKAVHDEVLLPFGYGDGGGGVTAEMLEFAERAGSVPGLPATRTGGEETFFLDATGDGADLPVWVGELYLETHRGTYTSQSRTKQANRLAEQLLREAEIWSTVAAVEGAPVDATVLDHAWCDVLVQQFHDILPGSSVPEVYDDASAAYSRAHQVAREVRRAAVSRLLGRESSRGADVFVFNGLSWDRSDPVEVVIPPRESEAVHLVGAVGSTHVAQVVERGEGGWRVLFEPAAVPSFGREGFRLVDGAVSAPGQLEAWDDGLENDFFRIELDGDGCISRLLDKREGREVVPHGARANEWQLFQDGPCRESAWNVYATFEKRRYPLDGPATIEVVEDGPVRASIRVTRPYRASRLQCVISVYLRTPRIDIRTEIDWQERQVMLKAAFPLSVRSAQATYEVQFGAIERPTHRNTSWDQQKFEVAGQRWADLSEAGYGVSLLTDSRYGWDAKDNVLRLTLLRGPEYPDPQADLGRHDLAYSLYPHAGTWGEAGTVRRAAELNAPMFAVATRRTAGDGPGPRASFLRVDGRGVAVETLKRAHDGDGWVLRLVEHDGGRGPVHVRFPRPPTRVVACNLVEEPGDEVSLCDGGFAFESLPFGVRTFRLWF